MPAPPEVVRDAVGSLSADQFASFVADLWRGRGYTVSRSGSRVTVAKHGQERVLCTRAAGESGPVPADTDAVVTATDAVEVPADLERIGHETLIEYFRYAISDETRSRLGRDYLGFESTPGEAQRGDAAGDTAADQGEPGPRRATEQVDERDDPPAGDESSLIARSRRAILVGAGGIVAGLGIGASTGLGPFESGQSVPGADPETPTPAPEQTVAVPGLSSDGVADANRLAEAHTNRIDATSFTISSIQTVHAESGRLLASLGLTTRVGGDGRFHAEIATSGPDGRPLFGRYPAEAALFSAGDRLYRKLTVDGETTYRSAPLGFGVNGWFYWSSTYPFGSIYYSAEGFYRDLFASVPVSVHSIEGDGDPPYRLLASDAAVAEPNPRTFALVDAQSGVEAVDLAAIVAGSGLVESLRLAYAGPREGVPATAQVMTRYRDLGETVVERPEWVDRAEPD